MSPMDLSLRLPSSAADRMREALAASVAAITLCVRRAAQQQELAELSDSQLDDTGIDRSLAGRGRSAAVSAAVLRRLESLSIG